MIIFNTTYLVSESSCEAWLEWVRNQHIPFMMSTGYFTLPQLSKVITEEPQDEVSFALQFTAANLHTLNDWNQLYENSFREELTRLFGTEVLYFTTLLEIME
jgi:hypothetical protein